MHSMDVDGKDTLKDWKLYPNEQIVFVSPELKESYVELNGCDGQLDMSEALTGYPVFNNREGAIDFTMIPMEGKINDRVRNIRNYIHGKRHTVRLADEPGWYYQGRLMIGEFEADKSISELSMEYNLEPYARADRTTTEDWLWDPFSFEDGVVYPTIYKSIAVNHTKSNPLVLELKYMNAGRMPVTPTFTVSDDGGQGLTAIFNIPEAGLVNYEKKLNTGSATFGEIVFAVVYEDKRHTISVYGTGTLSIDFRPGRL